MPTTELDRAIATVRQSSSRQTALLQAILQVRTYQHEPQARGDLDHFIRAWLAAANETAAAMEYLRLLGDRLYSWS